jgi:hypothetical protein
MDDRGGGHPHLSPRLVGADVVAVLRQRRIVGLLPNPMPGTVLDFINLWYTRVGERNATRSSVSRGRDRAHVDASRARASVPDEGWAAA